MRKKVFYFVVVLFSVLVLIVGFTLVQVLRYSGIQTAEKADAIVVLGAAEYAGRPSPVFRARLDHAYDLFKEGRADKIITTGGASTETEQSESVVGKKYLIQKGVPAGSIFTESDSQTTKQNLDRALEIAKRENIASVILVSDPFHMYRTKIIAEDLGLVAFTAPTQTSPIAQNAALTVKYVMRETGLVILHILFDL